MQGSTYPSATNLINHCTPSVLWNLLLLLSVERYSEVDELHENVTIPRTQCHLSSLKSALETITFMTSDIYTSHHAVQLCRQSPYLIVEFVEFIFYLLQLRGGGSWAGGGECHCYHLKGYLLPYKIQKRKCMRTEMQPLTPGMWLKRIPLAIGSKHCFLWSQPQ
jgi:hypothetical protein